MRDVTLLFGIGATKAGTSWLHAWLSQHPRVHLWTHKEVHYFDHFDLPGGDWHLGAARARRAAMAARLEQATGEAASRLARRIAEFDRYFALMDAGPEDDAAYLRFLAEGRGGADILGDITPAYALLSEDRLRAMGRLAPVTRFIYLLRDPVDRLWSNVRAMARSRAATDADVGPQARRIFDRWVAGQEEALALRADYAGALHRLFAAVPESDRFVGFFEDILAGGVVAPICRFLGLSEAPAPLAQVVNAGVPVALDATRRSIAADRLAPQYAAVKALVGDVPARWQSMGVMV